MKNINDTELEYFEWLMKQYTVDNDDEIEYSDCKLKWILKKYRDNVNYNRYNHIGCQVLLSRSTHQMVQSNDIHFDYVSIFEIHFRSVYRLLKKYRVDNITKLDWILKWYQVDNDNIDNTELDGKKTVFRSVSDNVDTYRYYFVNSNNGEIPKGAVSLILLFSFS